ncbi:MAG: single-stranded-DNA-specific exonuclease RecJ [Candidatus Dojkabacteria bacterium]
MALSELDFSPMFIQLLEARGFSSKQEVESFLASPGDEVFEYGKYLYESEKFLARINEAKKKGKKVLIYGDYDVDGMSAAALLWRFLHLELGAESRVVVPHRQRQGYGLNLEFLREELAKQPADLVITVDCGVRDGELVRQIKQEYSGLEVIVTDHHKPEEKSSWDFADVEVHPMHPSSNADELAGGEICAAAVVWGLVSLARKELLGVERKADGIELAALATVTDLMPLVGLNRAIVKKGLEQFRKTKKEGLLALADTAGVDLARVDAYTFGFQIGPRLNALGRIDEPLLGVKLLATQDKQAAAKLARKADSVNRLRQQLTEKSVKEAEQRIKLEEKILIVNSEDWHEGVIGLIAGRLMEKYNRPAVALARKETGEWVGSARSLEEFDVTQALAKNSDLLVRFGGHAQAAGLTIFEENLKKLGENLARLTEKIDFSRTTKAKKQADISFKARQFEPRLIDEVLLLAPFGIGNPKPRIKLEYLELELSRQFGGGGKHHRFDSSDLAEGVELLWFNSKWNEEKNAEGRDNYAYITTLGYNHWNGRKIPQIIIQDYAS